MARKPTRKTLPKRRKKVVKKKAAKKTRLTKRNIVNHLATTLDDSGLVSPDMNCKKIVETVLEDTAQLIESCVSHKGMGEFMLPGVVKFVTKEKPGIRKGTLVRMPGTGEMVKSKGRPASWRVTARPLARVKKAALS